MRTRLAALALTVALAALALPAAASADTVSLAFDPDPPVAGDTTLVTVSVFTAAPAAVFVLPNPPGTACAATPKADFQSYGASLTDPVNGRPVGPGSTTFELSWYPTAALPYTLCVYVSQTADSSPTALASVPVSVVAPQVAPPPFPTSSPPDVTDPLDTGGGRGTPRGRGNTGGQLVSRLHHHMFGTNPLPISIGATHKPANGDSGGATVSGDNRKTRLAAFHSAASNLVPGDTNGHTDVFVWQRPRGTLGLILNRLGGTLKRVSVSSSGAQADGDSTNPSLDGSVRSLPHCVAFQSTATNLAAGDGDATSDVYVRDLRTRHTYLVSRGIGPAATEPSIDGRCRQVAFQAGGGVYVGSAHGGGVHRIAGGSQPDYAMDGSAIAWTKGGSVWVRRRGVVSKIGPGANPHVTDEESGIWGIVFDTSSRLSGRDHDGNVDVYTRVVRGHGGPSRTDLISTASGGDAYNGGITAYGANRGIIVFAIHEGGGSGLWYRNNHTGNIDDLAFTTEGALEGIATSARANFVAFSSPQAISPLDSSPHATVFFKHLVDGESY